VVVREDVIEALHGVEDPELGMDIVELGLMYDVEVDGPSVKVLYSLTSMGCPAGAMIAAILHNLSTLLVLGNAGRLLRFHEPIGKIS